MSANLITQLPNVSERLLRTLDVAVNTDIFEEDLQTNQYYPSLYALSNTLSKYQIESSSYYVERTEIEDLHPPFICYLNGTSSGKDFVLVTERGKDYYKYYHKGAFEKKIPKERLAMQWLNTVLVVDSVGQPVANTSNIARSVGKARRFFSDIAVRCLSIIVIIMLAFGLIDPGLIQRGTMFPLCTKLLGSGISLMLLMHQFKKRNSFLDSVCGITKTNCDAVLTSKYARFLGISWSEIGFLYFAGSLLVLIAPSVELAQKNNVLVPLSLIALPYTCYSIYVQSRIIKQYCPLCLAIQGILVVEAGYALTSAAGSMVQPHIPTFISLGLLLILPAAVWTLLKPIFENASWTAIYRQAYKRTINSQQYFKSVMLEQESAPEGWSEMGITIGNPRAEYTILKVCNPYCGPCANMHREIEELIRINQNVKLHLIFRATLTEGDERINPVRHFLSLSQQTSADAFKIALDEWYAGDKKYEEFAVTHPADIDIQKTNEEVRKMDEWCKNANVTYTPTIYVNGKKIPSKYSIKDLSTLLFDN